MMLAGAEARFRVGLIVSAQNVLGSTFRFSASGGADGRDLNDDDNRYVLSKTVYGMTNDLAVTSARHAG